ncbi:MAG: hypothetical protein GY754_00835 [bacterium]|nr:hypothetical protein [bacterium]
MIEEPSWNVLFNFGLPLNISDTTINKYNYTTVVKNIIIASNFLLENKQNADYMRHFDSFKALLLALKTHYPSKFKEITKEAHTDLSSAFNLDTIQGKHIKLRNICLSNLSSYFSQETKFC